MGHWYNLFSCNKLFQLMCWPICDFIIYLGIRWLNWKLSKGIFPWNGLLQFFYREFTLFSLEICWLIVSFEYPFFLQATESEFWVKKKNFFRNWLLGWKLSRRRFVEILLSRIYSVIFLRSLCWLVVSFECSFLQATGSESERRIFF